VQAPKNGGGKLSASWLGRLLAGWLARA